MHLYKLDHLDGIKGLGWELKRPTDRSDSKGVQPLIIEDVAL